MQRQISSVFCITSAILCLLVSGATAQLPSDAPSTSPSSEAADLLKPQQLDALIAPIALYPDALLSQVLIASTYPLEVVEGARWSKSNSNLTGDDLKNAAQNQSWDDSVKSLAATPSVLEMMNDKLDWTQRLGDAVLAQQADVMDAVQRLRARASANNKLITTPQQRVTRTRENGRDVILIEPAEPDTIFVPWYDPAVVYGGWPYPEYPPYYWDAPGYIAGAMIATGIAFGAGYAIGRWASGGRGWGGGFAWGNNNINFDRRINNRNGFISGQTWHHDPNHRRHVPYHNAAVRQKFVSNRNVSGRTNRTDFKGRNGQQVLRSNAGGRAANRSRGDRAGRNVANRSSTAMKQNAARRSAGNRARAIRQHGNLNQRATFRSRANFHPRATGGGGFRRGGGFHGRAMRGGGGFHGGGRRGGGFHRR